MAGADSMYQSRDQEEGALSGLSVLDLTLARAGPTCVRQLADMGADVIRISAPDRNFELGHSDLLEQCSNCVQVEHDIEWLQDVE